MTAMEINAASQMRKAVAIALRREVRMGTVIANYGDEFAAMRQLLSVLVLRAHSCATSDEPWMQQ